MLQSRKRKIILFSSLLAVFVFIFLLNLLKVKEAVTGYVVQAASERASMVILFLMIAVLVGILLLATAIYRQNYRY